jgi:hypothetical protein
VDVKEISTQLGIFSMWAKVDLNPEQLSFLIAQLEPGNTSKLRFLTVPWSYTILVIHLRHN